MTEASFPIRLTACWSVDISLEFLIRAGMTTASPSILLLPPSIDLASEIEMTLSVVGRSLKLSPRYFAPVSKA